MVRDKCLEIMPCINILADGNNQASKGTKVPFETLLLHLFTFQTPIYIKLK